MSLSTRATVAALVTSVCVVALSGCALLPQKTFEETLDVEEEVTSVRFDGDSGSITVRGVEDQDVVTVHRELRYRFDLPDEETHRVSDGELVLEDCGPQCSVSYTLEVPAGIPVSGSTTNGGLDLSALGEVDVETSNGRIILAEIDGSVRASTSNGRIEGRELSGGEVDVETSNGSIDLHSDGEQDVTARTSNGSITLIVPEGDYRVDMETSNGRTESEVGSDQDAEVHLDLETSNGSISVVEE
ncbi:DUF4097 family beta strand repeat-containing protein [Salinibacterium sp. SYSU T00001]|uniref:DUF4097 family beta strand repeat-containing protein n=1 Tax=Homoserinimonas sedimenticola TaxID=2986805 RepID=UPI0022369BCC|nr:DUF4097 family beta strand repeat-containing protein [Salinibacterium sedimenticola]MCW4384795.1 DUF4097 family beta strand repeat-containing protein [Salinibacterium sedimenticola]